MIVFGARRRDAAGLPRAAQLQLSQYDLRCRPSPRFRPRHAADFDISCSGSAFAGATLREDDGERRRFALADVAVSFIAFTSSGYISFCRRSAPASCHSRNTFGRRADFEVLHRLFFFTTVPRCIRRGRGRRDIILAIPRMPGRRASFSPVIYARLHGASRAAFHISVAKRHGQLPLAGEWPRKQITFPRFDELQGFSGAGRVLSPPRLSARRTPRRRAPQHFCRRRDYPALRLMAMSFLDELPRLHAAGPADYAGRAA